VLASEGKGVAGVFHCFTGGVDRARKALDLGFHLSLAGIVTFPKATDLHEVAGFVPDDRLLVETDSPFLAPVPHRGKRNEPAFVSHVVDALAAIRGTSPGQVAALTTRNFLELFARTAVTPR
jgi:TatD DNase family protein